MGKYFLKRVGCSHTYNIAYCDNNFLYDAFNSRWALYKRKTCSGFDNGKAQ